MFSITIIHIPTVPIWNIKQYHTNCINRSKLHSFINYEVKYVLPRFTSCKVYLVTKFKLKSNIFI